jgi:hypothetical protein
MVKEAREKYFDRKEWKHKLSLITKRHPDLKTISGRLEILFDKGEVLKTTIKHKDI